MTHTNRCANRRDARREATIERRHGRRLEPRDQPRCREYSNIATAHRLSGVVYSDHPLNLRVQSDERLHCQRLTMADGKSARDRLLEHSPAVRIGRSRWTTSSTLRCPGPANHHDPVTTSHLPGGEPGPIAKICTAARDVREIQGDRDSRRYRDGQHCPTTRQSPGRHSAPARNDQGYCVRVERNLHWVTDGTYQSAFLTTRDGVVLIGARQHRPQPTVGRGRGRRCGRGGLSPPPHS